MIVGSTTARFPRVERPGDAMNLLVITGLVDAKIYVVNPGFKLPEKLFGCFLR